MSKLASRMREQNQYGVLVYNELERALLRAYLLSNPCKTCGAAKGEPCRYGIEESKVHFGRLPEGFNSQAVVDEMLTKLDW